MRNIWPVFLSPISLSKLCALYSAVCGTQLMCTHSTHKRHGLHKTDIGFSQGGGTAFRRDGSALSRHNGSTWRECLSYLNWKKKKRPTAERGAVALTTAGYRRAVAQLCACWLSLCSVRVYNWPEPQASNSLRAALWGLGSGEIRAMYLCGPSVLACWAGKAVLILILHPLYFWGRRECPHIAALCPSGMPW